MIASKDKSVLDFIKKNQRPFSCTLTISILVSNSIKTIQNCLDSIVPLLNQVSSELIIVDTIGEEKSDGSLAIAKKYTDNIIHYKWNNDFSAARNAGLAVAKGEWFLFIDDDEWFEDVSELVSFFQNRNMANRYCALAFNKHNYYERRSDIFSDIMVTQCSRLFRNTKFKYPVHENLFPIMLPVKHVNCYVHHYGYADKKLDKKLDRNKPIMLSNLASNPTNMHLWAQLITSYEVSIDKERKLILKDSHKAMMEFQRANLKGVESFSNFVVIFCCELTCEAFEKNWNSIIRKCQAFVGNYGKLLSSFQYCALDYYLMEALFNSQRIAESNKILWDVLSDYLYQLKLVKKTTEDDVENYTPFLHDKVSYGRFFEFFINLATESKQNRDWSKLNLIMRKLPLEHAGDKYSATLQLVIESIINGEHPQSDLQYLYNEAYSSIGRKNNQDILFAKSMRQAKRNFPNKNLPKLLAKLQGNDSYLDIQKMLFYNYDIKELRNRIKNLVSKKKLDNKSDCEEFFLLLIKKQINPNFLVEDMPYAHWNQMIQEVADQLIGDRNELRSFITKIKQVWPDCLKRQTLIVLLHRQYLFSDFATISEIQSELPEYLNETISLSKSIYSSLVFLDQTKVDLLPVEFRFALMMKEALNCAAEKNLKQYLKLLRNSLDVFPAAKFMISKLKWQVINENTKKAKNNNEFEKLGKQVKQQIFNLLLKGENQAALPLIKQLKELMPNDSETKSLYKEVVSRQ
ncbi:MAG: glycosyltransferase [Liquorilactobacillus sp.]|uniref:glycosyltransferase n=1 Tax=Liquorilactobacillus nagelii TaxID=82688 RepID=UPI0039E847C5